MIPGDETVTREILINVPPWLETGFYVLTALALGWAVLAFVLRFLLHRRGRRPAPEPMQYPGWSEKAKAVLAFITAQKPLRRDRLAGIAHLMVGWGFFWLFVGTTLVFLEHDTPLHFFYGPFYLVSSLLVDLGGIIFCAGLVLFLWRRYMRPEVPVLRAWWTEAMTWLLLVIGITGFLLEGARIASPLNPGGEVFPDHEIWSIGGYVTALGLDAVGLAGERAVGWHRGLWIFHAIVVIAFFALLPWRFVSHMVYGLASWATRTARRRHTMRPAPGPAPGDDDRIPGAVGWEDFSTRDLLQADACTTCGRCNAVCPAHAAGKPLQPRDVVLGLRDEMSGRGATGDLALRLGDDVLDACTTCGACNETCPVGIEIFDKLLDLRRGRVERGRVPAGAETLFESTAERMNPYGKPHADRLAFASGMNVPVAEEAEPVELLYWIGCAGAYDPDGQSVARDMLRILNHLGIEYRVLGRREACTGDPARRVGEEGLFRELAARNIQTLHRHGVRRILTHCPHCFNTFRNEYPELGGDFEVEHHSQFLARMIREGRLELPGGAEGRITFHDPCYLGRGNDETQAPRDVLRSLPQLEQREMPRHGKQSFCCGAGGGAMWMETRGKTRVENLRAREAAETGAGTVATACPFCKSMLTAGAAHATPEEGAPLEIRDLAELVVQAEGI